MDQREKAAIVSALANVVLAGLKAALAVGSGSLGLLADAWHSASDVAVSLLVYAGLRLSRRNWRRAWLIEGFVASAVGILICGAGISLALGAGEAQAQVVRLPLAIGGAFAFVIAARLLARYKIRVGTAEDSMSVRADGYHSQMDMYSSIVVLVGLLGQMIGFSLDRVASLLVAFLVAVTGLEVIAQAARAVANERAFEMIPLRQLILQRLPAPAAALVDGILSGLRTRLGGPRGRLGDWRRRHHRGLATLLSLLIGAAYATSGATIVRPDQIGMVKRFGRVMDHDLGPGVHLCFPAPIDQVVRIRPAETVRCEFGFRSTSVAAVTSGQVQLWESAHGQGGYQKVLDEALLLTGDENIVDVNMVVHYTVSNPRAYLFGLQDPDALIRGITESALRAAIGQTSIDAILTERRSLLSQLIKDRVTEELKRLDAGIEVRTILLQDVHPPREVVSAFRDVASAREDRERLIHEAHAYQEEVVPVARARAEQIKAEAESYGIARVSQARGETSAFVALAGVDSATPLVTATRLYLEAVDEVLPPLEKYILHGESGESFDLRFTESARMRVPPTTPKYEEDD